LGLNEAEFGRFLAATGSLAGQRDSAAIADKIQEPFGARGVKGLSGAKGAPIPWSTP